MVTGIAVIAGFLTCATLPAFLWGAYTHRPETQLYATAAGVSFTTFMIAFCIVT